MQGEFTTHLPSNEAGHLPNTLQQNELQIDERSSKKSKSMNNLKENLGGNLIN